ncbi:MAG TPA: hypothetical protein HPP87_07250 [Planctomycetes bacterium]|nr:hypothetical protein [Planctomycetota bacterium]
MVEDCTCDMNCPEVPGVGKFTGICCANCRTARRGYLNKENQHLWTDEKGFLGDNGCRLPRGQMPPECKAYDCKHRKFYVSTIQYADLTFDGEKWVQSPIFQKMMVGWVGEDNIEKLVAEIRRRLMEKADETHEKQNV